MKVNDYDITFETTTYADAFNRKAVFAVVESGDEEGCFYGDVTINIPNYSLKDEESFLSNDCPNLIDTMVENGYLIITDNVKVNYGSYRVGTFTKKFENEFGVAC